MMRNKSGFGVVGIIIGVVCIGLIVALGWVFFERQQEADKTDSATNDSQQSTDNNEPVQQDKPYTAKIPTGWSKKVDPTNGAMFAVPDAWGDSVKVSKFAVDEAILIGYGAPVAVRYSTSAETWQTLDADDNNEFTTVRPDSDSIVVTSSTQTHDKNMAATYTSGDGTTAQDKVLVLSGSQVFQFELPATCKDMICDGDEVWTKTKISETIPRFIETIALI